MPRRKSLLTEATPENGETQRDIKLNKDLVNEKGDSIPDPTELVVNEEDEEEEDEPPEAKKIRLDKEERKDLLITEQLCGEESRDAAPPAEDNDKGDNFPMGSHKIKVVETPAVANLETVSELAVGSIESVSQLAIGSVETVSQLEKRNLSLEALCEVGSSELQNIQRQGSPSTPQNHESTSNLSSSQESNSGASSTKIKIVNPEDIRKRKHPAKPGKHICTFCGRGCAKPSVLEKHLRAHTGERPFPCLDCGFAFKTKSNLYKHCKSRSHALKVKLGRKVKQWSSQEDTDNDDVDEYDDEGLNESQSSNDTLDREEISLTPNEAEQITLLNDMSKFLKKVDSEPTTNEPLQKEDSFENREQAPVHVLQEVAKYLEKPKAERPRIEVPSWKSDARPRFETRMRNLNLEFEQNKNLAQGGKKQSVVDEQKLNSAQSQFITIAPKQNLSRALSTGTEVTDQLATIHKMGSGGSVTVHRLLLPAMALPNMETMSVQSSNTSISNVAADKVIAIDNGTGAVEVIRLPHPNTDPSTANQALRELESLSERVQQSSGSEVQLVPAVVELQDGTCQVSVKAVPARESHAPLVRSFSQPAGEMKTKTQGDSRVDMEKVKERIQNLISSNAAIVKSPLFEYKRLYRQNSESKGSVQKSFSITKSDSLHSELSVSTEEKIVTSTTVIKPDGTEKSVSISIPSLIQEDNSKTSSETKPETVTTRRLVRQSALTSSDNVEAKPQVSSGSSLNVLTISNEILKQIAEANSSGAPKPNPSGANRTQEIASKTVTGLDHSGKEITIKLQLENPVTTESVKPTKESSDGQSKAIKDKIREVIKARDIPPPVTKSLSESTINIPLKDRLGNISSVSVSNPVKSTISVEKKEQFECDFCKNAFQKKETLDLHMAYYCTYIKAHDSIDKSKVLQMFHKTESEKRPMEGLVKRQISLPVIQFPRQVSTTAITRTSLSVRSDSIGVIKSTDSGVSKQLSLPVQFSGGVINISSASIPSVVDNITNKKGRPKLIERQPRISLPSTHPLPSTHALPHTPLTGSMYPLNQIASVVPTQLQTMLGGSQVKSPHPSVITSHQTRAANNKATPLSVTYSATPYSSQSLPKPAPEVQQPVIIQNVMSVNKALIFPDNQKEQTEMHVDKQQVSSAPVTDVHSMIQVQIVGPVGGEMLGKPASLQPLSMVQLAETPQPSTIIVHRHPDAKQKDKHFIHSSSDSSEHSSPHILNEDLKEKLKGKLLMKRSLSLDPKVLQLSGSSELLKEECADPPANKKIKLVTVTLPVKGGEIASSTALELEPKAWRIQTLTIPVVRAQPMYQLSQMDSHLMFIDKSSQSSGISSFLAEQNLMKMDSAKAISVTASGTQSTEKGGTVSVPLILYGHNYPSLRMSTQVSFCCVSRPQPMYVPLKSNKKISMYSNWKVSGHNTNPIGLTPKMLFSLYRSDSCTDPSYTTAYSQASKGGMSTHSSYWTYKEKKTGSVQSDKKPEVKKEEDTDKPISSTKVTTPKKVTGGIKSLDPYVYVRGRGRGKYICNECGIRCKKPSMLKKHIRSHTNLRPYVCWHCHFSFKTKGNLTKHMKSKSHHKKCLELGIVPVPTQVDESQIDQQMLKAQCDLSKKARIVLKDGASVSVDLDDINSESDDDEEEDEEDIQDQESMDTQGVHQETPDVVIEINVNSEEIAAAQDETTHVPNSPKSRLEGIERGLLGSNPVICSMIQPHPHASQGPHPLGQPEGDIAHQRELQTVQELSNSSQRIIHMEEESSNQHASLGTIYGFHTEATTVEDHLSTNMVEITEVYISEGDPKLGFLFEELRKHKTELQTRNTNSPPSDVQSKKDENTPLPLASNIDEVREADNSGKKSDFDSRETISVSLDKNLDIGRKDTEVTIGKSTPPSVPDVNATAHVSVIGSILSPSKGTTQEMKKAKVEPPRQLEFSIPLGGFMPPHAIFKQPKQSNSGPIIGQLIRQRPVNLQFSSPVKTPTSQATPICAPFQFHHPFIEKHDSQDMNAPSNSENTERMEESETQNKTLSEEKLNVTNVEGQEEEEGYHSYIIIETSEGQTVNALSPVEVRGEQVLYQCQFCEGLIEPEHILNHLKTHKMEHIYPCETCGVVFPSKEKFKNHTHEKSASVKSDPEMCDMCQQSFTSSDELSQHFKTKTHIDKLEELGVVSKGTFSNIERNMESLSTSDHEEFVELLKSKIACHVESTEHSHSPTQFQGQPQFEKNPSASSDKVTVEIKQESSDFCQMTSASSDYSPERGVSPNMPHLCEICRRGFINLEHLKAHLVSHAEIRPYVCEYCDAGFTNSQSLKTHLLSHAQERPYVCGYCGETFPISSDLKKHAEILHKISSTMTSKADVENNDARKSPLINSSGGAAPDSLHSDQTRSPLKAKGADSNPE